MNAAVPDCLIEDYEHLIDGLKLPDEDDRHVLAAAIEARADTIVTINLKDFPPEAIMPYGIEALHPDEFVIRQMDLSVPAVIAVVRQQRASLLHPPLSAEQFVAALARQQLPQTVERLSEFAGEF
jgi:hypothetical protein